MRYYLSCIFATLMFVGCGGGGSENVVISSSSLQNPPNISDHLAVTLANSEPIAPLKFDNSGGEILNCTISPQLPSGLTLSSDCSISGTPTVNQNSVTYTVTASNSRGEDNATIDIEVIPSVVRTVVLKGKITYDSVPVNANGVGLDYTHITKKSVRGAFLKVVDAANQELGSTTTDENGTYELTVTGTTAKVQVYAEMNSSNWNFQVKDNTNNNTLYVMEGSLASLGTSSTQTRNLNAPSGWGGSSYTSTRAAAPFAILDVIYQAIQMVRSADSSISFPPLDIFWSKNNKAASGDVTIGEIETSSYNGSALYILGDEDADTDEYDSGVIAHEWGHYYEAKFSRADSIGGLHSGGELLDIRLAFGEGFGNAISSMIRDNPNYWDASGQQQANGWSMNLEDEFHDTPGWFSESSIQRILYDIYDSHDDTGDTISYGFTPIHNVLVGKEKNTPAFTSLFTFIKGLKDEHPSDATAIDNIVAQESIAPITDIYGTGRTNRSENANPLYADLSIGHDVNITTNYTAISSSSNYQIEKYGRHNQLGTYNFVKVTIPADGTYTITVTQIGNLDSSNPDFYLYDNSSNQPIAAAENLLDLSDSLTTNLEAGTYRMDIIVYNQYSGTKYNVKLVKN